MAMDLNKETDKDADQWRTKATDQHRDENKDNGSDRVQSIVG